MIRRIAVATLALLTLAGLPAQSDRIHLAGGGTIDTGSWWLEGDVLMYRSAAGTVGIPRSLVSRIEAADGTQEIGESSAAAENPPQRTSSPASPADSLAGRMNRANALLEGREFRDAADLYETLLGDTPGEIAAPRVGYAVSQMALGEDAIALAVVLDALAWNPEHPTLLELRGDLSNRAERVEDALGSWREAFTHGPSDRLREKIEDAERELAVGRRYDLATTSHFNLRYDGEVDGELADAVVEWLEKRFWELAAELDHTPRQPITVVLYPTRAFRDVTQAPEWVGGLYDGKIRVPLGGLRRLDDAPGRVLTHELTHAFVHSKTRGLCPRWLHEGIAQRAEGRSTAPAAERRARERLEQADPGRWLEASEFSYEMSLHLVRYLEHRRGFHAVVDLLERLGEGASMDEALETTYGADRATLLRDWVRWSREGSR